MIPRGKGEKYRRAVFEMMCLKRYFPQFQASIVRGTTLSARGTLLTEEGGDAYRVDVNYTPGFSPDIRIVKPVIPYNPTIHMYKNETLCLFDWREQPWQPQWHIHQTVIPWTAEWLVFYELYLLTGKWLGKSALHGSPVKTASPVENSRDEQADLPYCPSRN